MCVLFPANWDVSPFLLSRIRFQHTNHDNPQSHFCCAMRRRDKVHVQPKPDAVSETPPRSAVVHIDPSPSSAGVFRGATRHATPSVASTSSSLAGTKQWVDDVLQLSANAGHNENTPRGCTSSSNRSVMSRPFGTDSIPPACERSVGSNSSASDEDTIFEETHVVNRRVFLEDSPKNNNADPTASSGHASMPTSTLLSLFLLLDMNNDGMVTFDDMFSFLALHPQALDLKVARAFHAVNRRQLGLGRTATGSLAGDEGLLTHSASSAVLTAWPVANGTLRVLQSSLRAPHRYKELSQLPRPRTLSELPHPRDVEGDLWWLHHRVRQEECATRFVSFVHHMADSLCKSACAAKESADAAVSGNTSHSGSGCLSFYAFQLLYRETVRLLHSKDVSCVVVVLDVPMLQQVLWFYEYLHVFAECSGRVWSPPPSQGGPHKVGSECFTGATQSGKVGVSPAERLLRGAQDYTSAARLVTDQNAVLGVDASHTAWRNFFIHQRRLQTTGDDGEASPSTAAPSPLSTALPAVYWTFASWDSDVQRSAGSILQRLGARYLRRKASKHTKRMQQFLRHLWASKSMAAAADVIPGQRFLLQTQETHSIEGSKSSSAPQPKAGRVVSRHASSALVSENIALLQLSNRFLAFHGIRDPILRRAATVSTSSSSSVRTHQQRHALQNEDAAASDDAGENHLLECGQQPKRYSWAAVSAAASATTAAKVDAPKCRKRRPSLLDHVARDGVRALWDVDSAASTQASPDKLTRRATWRAAQSATNKECSDRYPSTAAPQSAPPSVCANEGAADGGDSLVRQSLLTQDHVLHTMLRPTPLCMIPTLNMTERMWLSHATRWCTVRAAMYALFAAVLIGAVDLVAQSYFLGATSGGMYSLVLSFDSVKSLFLPMGSTVESVANHTAAGSTGVLSQVDAATATGLMPFIKYQVIVMAVTLVVSALEILALYVDNLQVCLGMARTGGIPLDTQLQQHQRSTARSGGVAAVNDGGANNMSRSSYTGAGGGVSLHDNSELCHIRDHLSQRRVKYLVDAISRCALQMQFDTVTVFGLDVRDRNKSRIRVLLQGLADRCQRIAPSLFLRVVASRILSRFLVPFLATPLLMFWNCLLTRRSLNATRTVVLGAVSVERMVIDLLRWKFEPPQRMLQHNANIVMEDVGSCGRTQKISNASPTGSSAAVVGSHVYLTRPIFAVPFHVLREMVSICIFYAHVVHDDKAVHPALHCLLVQLITSCEFPDVCMWLAPKEKKRREPPPSTPALGITTSAVFHSSPLLRPQSARQKSSPHSVPTSKYVEGVLLDVAVGKSSALSSWMRTFVRELNGIRLEVDARWRTADSEWVRMYVDSCPWPRDADRRASLQRLCPSLISNAPSRGEAKVEFLMEHVFPSWASSETVGPLPHTLLTTRSRRAGGAHEAFIAGSAPFGNDADETRAKKASNSWGFFSEFFSPRHKRGPGAILVDAADEPSEDAHLGRAQSSGTTATSASSASTAPHNPTYPGQVHEPDARNTKSASPFSNGHVKLFLVLTVMTSVLTTCGGARISACVKKRTMILHVFRAYRTAAAAASQGEETWLLRSPHRCERAEAELLKRIDSLHEDHWGGIPSLNVHVLERMIDECCQILKQPRW